MKRMIIMALGVALAVSAQAAAVNWKITGTPVGSGKTVYAFLESDRSAITALLEADTTGTSWNSDLSSYAYSSATSSSRAANGFISSDKLTAGSSYDLFFVICTDTTSYRIANNTLSSTAYNPASPSSDYPEYAASSSTLGSTIKFADQTGGGGGEPEPTSGLLMLVGLGVLGLRRKRK